MKFPRVLPALLLALLGSFGVAAVPTPTLPLDPGEMSEAEFASLVEKTNLYVRALNRISNAQRSYDRYASWVNVKKGPTGKERYISYGLYEISKSSVEEVKEAAQKGPRMSPPLPELDAIIVRLAESFSGLEPLVKKAHDYYEQEDFRDDNAQGAQELHAAMMPLFTATFASEAELRRGLDELKAKVDQRQLALLEKSEGRKYEWHLRTFMLAAKALINLLPENAAAPPIEREEYLARYAALEQAYTALQNYTAANPDEMKKFLMASLVETAVKDFFTASKFLRRTVEARQRDQREYLQRLGDLAQKYNSLINRTNSVR